MKSDTMGGCVTLVLEGEVFGDPRSADSHGDPRLWKLFGGLGAALGAGDNVTSHVTDPDAGIC